MGGRSEYVEKATSKVIKVDGKLKLGETPGLVARNWMASEEAKAEIRARNTCQIRELRQCARGMDVYSECIQARGAENEYKEIK